MGCGAIGREIALSIDAKKIPNCKLSILFDMDSLKLESLHKDLRTKPSMTLMNLLHHMIIKMSIWLLRPLLLRQLEHIWLQY